MATASQPEASVVRRSADRRVSAAIDLGWRVAALHALNAATLVTPAAGQDVLRNRQSLGAADRLELELRAIAGVAQRVGVPLANEHLAGLLKLVSAADDV